MTTMANITELKQEVAEITAAKQAIVSCLHGLRDAGVALGHDDYTIPPEMHEQVKRLMLSAAETEASDSSEFERGGKWHLAANVVMLDLDRESRAMTAGYEYPQGLPWGDKMHKALLEAMKAAA